MNHKQKLGYMALGANRKSLLGLLALGFLLSCTQSPQEKVRNATVRVARELKLAAADRPKGVVASL